MKIITMVLRWQNLCQQGVLRNIHHPLGKKIDLLIEFVTLDDKIGHLFVVDIEFDKKNVTERELLYNKVLPPVIEKQKLVDANERSIYRLLDQYQITEKGAPKAYHCTKK